MFKFVKFLWLGKLETLENEKASYAVGYIEESRSILLQKYFKSDPDESEIKFNVSYAKFWTFREVSIVGRQKTLNSEQMRYSVGFLKVNCSFTLEKCLKMTPLSKKKVLAVVRLISEFLLKLPKLLNSPEV